MSMWKTTLNLTHQNGNLKRIPIKIVYRYFFLSILNTLVKRTKPNRIWLWHPEKEYKLSILYGWSQAVCKR